MNQTKFNTTTAQEIWQLTCFIFHNHSVDILILQIYNIFTALAITTSNVALLYKLSKKKHETRTDKIFIILSCSDIGVGLFSIPVISLELFICGHGFVGAMFSLIWYFSACFPHSFSWTLIIIITLDRVLIITKAHVYKKYVTMKVLYWVIILCLLSTFIVMTLFIIEINFKQNLHVMFYIVLSAELCFILITITAHVYLFHFVQSKSRKIANKRYGRINFNKKLMITIAYIYLCLLVFTLPHFLWMFISFSVHLSNKRMWINLNYWTTMLIFSNSYANSFIILYRSRGNHKVTRENKREPIEHKEDR